jgi:hypothetical protein
MKKTIAIATLALALGAGTLAAQDYQVIVKAGGWQSRCFPATATEKRYCDVLIEFANEAPKIDGNLRWDPRDETLGAVSYPPPRALSFRVDTNAPLTMSCTDAGCTLAKAESAKAKAQMLAGKTLYLTLATAGGEFRDKEIALGGYRTALDYATGRAKR